MAKVNIKQIAEQTKLSPSTVSQVLNGRGDQMRIAKKTQELIINKAKQLGYQPNIYARRLRRKTSDHDTAIIGVLWPSRYTSDLLVRFYDGIQTHILEEKLNLEVVFKPYIFSQIWMVDDVLSNSIFNGVIIVGAADEDVEYLSNIQTTMPIVYYNRQDDRFCSVGNDNFATGERVAGLFAARGHRNVALIESGTYTRQFMLRKSGFLSGCEKYGMQIDPKHIVPGTAELMRKSSEQIILSENRPTAVFLMVSELVNELYQVCHEHNIAVPDDLEVLGLGDTGKSELVTPQLSVIDFPLEEMAKHCLNLLNSILKGEVLQTVNILVKTDFIFRASCGGYP